MRRWLGAGAMAAYLAFFLLPLAAFALVSLWPEAELGAAAPSHLTLEAYVHVLRERSFLTVAANSLEVATLATLFSLALGTPAAFAIAKLETRGRTAVLALALALAMLPQIALVGPLYLAMKVAGLRDSLPSLVVPYASFTLPLTIWVMTSFFRQIPDELLRAARVDGCTPLRAFRRVFLPLAGPGLATTGLLVFIASWNEFLFALSFLSSADRHTLPVAISLFAAGFREPWTEITAASVLATAPLVAVTLVFQKAIARGLTAGAIKE